MANVFDVDAYISSLKTKYNIADDDLKQVSEIKSGFLRQDDYSRRQQALDAERQRIAAVEQQWLDYEESVRAFEATYGPRDQWPAAFAAAVGRQNPTGQGMQPAINPADIARMIAAEVDKREQALREEFKQELELAGNGSVAFTKFYLKANKRWESEYGTPLPEDDFQNFIRENGHVNPIAALQLFEIPFKEKKREEEWERKAQDREREAERRGRSQANIPETSTATSSSVPFIGTWAETPAAATGTGDNAPAELTRDQRVALFNERMEKVRASGGIGAQSQT